MHSTLYHHQQFHSSQSDLANGLYACARQRAQRGQFWASLAGRFRGLLSLAEVCAACSVAEQSDAGIRTVAIDQIRGSENRCTDFDADFHPLREHNRDRWLSIAQARQRGRALPPVALIQVGDLYFVRDGHHRISVARALGQKAIEATVVVWRVVGPLPWEVPAQTMNRGAQGLTSRLRRGGARLQERVLPSLRDVLAAAGDAPRRPSLSHSGLDTL